MMRMPNDAPTNDLPAIDEDAPAHGQGLDSADKMEAAKRRLDRALNGLERRVATHSDRLRQTNARDVAALRAQAQSVERERRHLAEELQRLDAYLGEIEQGLAKTQPATQPAGQPPALPQREV